MKMTAGESCVYIVIGVLLIGYVIFETIIRFKMYSFFLSH